MSDYPSFDDDRPAISEDWPQSYEELLETEDEEWERSDKVHAWLVLAAMILFWLLWSLALVFFTQGITQFDAT